MSAWIDLFDSNHTIYANARHRAAHFKLIAREIASYIPTFNSFVLDFSCGEATSAEIVSESCSRLYLSEPAPGIRKRLLERFKDDDKIKPISLEDIDLVDADSIDLVVMHSVSQYMTNQELEIAFRKISRVLKPSGKFLLGDILNPEASVFKDAIALLNFALKENFLFAALLSLIRTYFSSYMTIRKKNALATYTDNEIQSILKVYGFHSAKLPKNLGHNQTRSTFLSRLVD